MSIMKPSYNGSHIALCLSEVCPITSDLFIASLLDDPAARREWVRSEHVFYLK